MKKQHYLFSPLIFLFVLVAFGCENNDTADQTSASDQTSTAVQNSGGTAKTGQKNRLNNFVDWATYRGDQEGTAYSTLSQITTENVQSLEEVWHHDTRVIVGPGMQQPVRSFGCLTPLSTMPGGRTFPQEFSALRSIGKMKMAKTPEFFIWQKT